MYETENLNRSQIDLKKKLISLQNFRRVCLGVITGKSYAKNVFYKTNWGKTKLRIENKRILWSGKNISNDNWL